jgi:hypothetical protein
MPDDREFTPSHMQWAKCGKVMRLIAIEPSEAVRGADEITYHCAFCDHVEKRIRTVDT